ncbi:MAG: ribonuclease D, partial [Candidatus Eremiobacterota bacterium]
MSERNAPPLIDTHEALQPVWGELAGARVLGLDLEMDSYYSYFEKVCLVQLSTERSDFLIDPLAELDLSPLAPFLADPSTVKVLHAGENDIPYLRGPLGFEVNNIFDTYLAARVLGCPRCGLASLLQEHFGVVLDKDMQTADWRVRPLPEAQMEYARMDTRYLLPLRDKMRELLAENEMEEQARSEFDRITRLEHTPRQFDPLSW